MATMNFFTRLLPILEVSKQDQEVSHLPIPTQGNVFYLHHFEIKDYIFQKARCLFGQCITINELPALNIEIFFSSFVSIKQGFVEITMINLI